MASGVDAPLTAFGQEVNDPFQIIVLIEVVFKWEYTGSRDCFVSRQDFVPQDTYDFIFPNHWLCPSFIYSL